jgi:Secretion system C-terminal sorting domain
MNKRIYILVFTFLLSTIGFTQTNGARTYTSNPTTTNFNQIKIIKSYPNPATDNITFEFQRNYNTGYSIEIYNLPGKRVTLVSNLSPKTPVVLNNYYRGVYIYKLVDRTGKVIESGKFQVVK